MAELCKMSSIKVTLADSGLVLNHDINSPLLETLLVAGEDVPTECGGTGICGTCSVKILPDPPEPQASDYDYLADEDIEDGWRLACQCHPAQDSIVELNRDIQSHGMIIQTQGIKIVEADRSLSKINNKGIGLALDIGTTTIVGYLSHFEGDGEDLIIAFPNPQRMAGADVISRISYAHESIEALERLTRLVTGQIERRAEEALKSKGFSACDITHISVAGNMTMAHLFVGEDPWSLGVAPYQPGFTAKPVLKAPSYGLDKFKNADVMLVPGIAGHLGGDTVAGLYALNLMESNKTELFLDLGTNGEIIIIHNGKALGCSCAAGPAFEGVKISCGMPAVPGAINDISFKNGDISFTTFDEQLPIGLCGTALADLITEMLKNHIIFPNGRLKKPEQLPDGFPKSLANRIIPKGRSREFIISNDSPGHKISLTQLDIRELQLAKAAFRTGIEALCQHINLSLEKIENVYVAGGFGNALKSETLISLGILPVSLKDKINSVGNIAGVGAKKALHYDPDGEKCGLIGNWVEHFSLESSPGFVEHFTERLAFPEPDEVTS